MLPPGVPGVPDEAVDEEPGAKFWTAIEEAEKGNYGKAIESLRQAAPRTTCNGRSSQRCDSTPRATLATKSFCAAVTNWKLTLTRDILSTAGYRLPAKLAAPVKEQTAPSPNLWVSFRGGGQTRTRSRVSHFGAGRHRDSCPDREASDAEQALQQARADLARERDAARWAAWAPLGLLTRAAAAGPTRRPDAPVPATAARLLAEGRGQLAAGRLASAVAVLEQVPADGPTPELRATLGEARWQEYLQRTAGKPGKPDPADAEVRAALKDFEAAGTAGAVPAGQIAEETGAPDAARALYRQGRAKLPQATPTLRRRPPTPRLPPGECPSCQEQSVASPCPGRHSLRRAQAADPCRGRCPGAARSGGRPGGRGRQRGRLSLLEGPARRGQQ